MNSAYAPAGSLDRKYYEVATPHSFAERVMIRAREQMFKDFLRICSPGPADTIIDVGVSDVITDAANMLERRYAHPERITAVGLGTAGQFRAAFPGVTYRQIVAGEPLPFPDKSFDIATSNAVLEHVGSVANQRRFVSELTRVASRGFITVPNRFFPVEHHTGIPFLHWTDGGFGLACTLLGKEDWARPENLILLSPQRLRAACPPNFAVRMGTTGILLGPFSSSLYLYWDEQRPH
jgi:hypothetical protein